MSQDKPDKISDYKNLVDGLSNLIESSRANIYEVIRSSMLQLVLANRRTNYGF